LLFSASVPFSSNGNVPVTVQLIIRYPINGTYYFIPVNSTLFTPVFWKSIQLYSSTFCSQSVISVYGQFVPNYEYALNYTLNNGVTASTDWCTVRISENSYIHLYIPF